MYLLLYAAPIAFWLLLCLGFERLRWKGTAIAIAVWAALRLACVLAGWMALFVSVVTLSDLALILVIFRPNVGTR